MTTDLQYRPLLDDVALNAPESNAVLDGLVTGEIKVLRLFECDPTLFAQIKQEAFGLVAAQQGQPVGADHPTAVYVRSFDPSWSVKPDSIQQYSLYNSANDLLYNDEDHHWQRKDRRFNSCLRAVPEFVRRYLGHSVLQNFRMQCIRGGGDLGRHREKILGIPGRERQFKLRFHLPVVTNPAVSFAMDDLSFVMEEGWVYLFNQACTHGVSNEGTELRIHLIFDCYLADDDIVRRLIGPAWRSAA